MAYDHIIVIEKVDKDSCVIVWDRTDYLLEAEKQLSKASIYQSIEFKDKHLTDPVKINNKSFILPKRA